MITYSQINLVIFTQRFVPTFISAESVTTRSASQQLTQPRGSFSATNAYLSAWSSALRKKEVPTRLARRQVEGKTPAPPPSRRLSKLSENDGPVFTCGEASRSMDDIWPSSFRKICQIQPFRGQKSTGTWVIKATEFKFKVRRELGRPLRPLIDSDIIAQCD